MSVSTYEELRAHVGHKIVCVRYGRDREEPYNVALECEDCHEVLLDFNHPDVERIEKREGE